VFCAPPANRKLITPYIEPVDVIARPRTFLNHSETEFQEGLQDRRRRIIQIKVDTGGKING